MRNALGGCALNIIYGFIALVIILTAAAILGNPLELFNITIGK